MNAKENVPDWLDRLVLDEALGALDPDVRSLLDAHAEERAGLQHLRNETRVVARLARSVCCEPGFEVPAADEPRRATRIAAVRSERVMPGGFLRIAAAAAVGLGLGLIINLSSPPSGPGDAAVRAAPAETVEKESSTYARADAHGFDARAWYEQARAQRRYVASERNPSEHRDNLLKEWGYLP